MSLFDLLPEELNNIIASYYALNSRDKTSVDVLINMNIRSYKLLYITTYSQYYDVTKDEFQVEISDDNYYIILLKESCFDEKSCKGKFSRSVNIYYRYLFKQQFPYFYEKIKDIIDN